MTNEDDALAEALATIPAPPLSAASRARTLARARRHLVAMPETTAPLRWQRLSAQAVSAALLSADAVFVADTCLRMKQIWGG
jgi:hypothetical protein